MLFVAPLPPPVTGMGGVSSLILTGLASRFRFRVVDFSKGTLRRGFSAGQIRRAAQLAAVPFLARSRSCVYLALSQSRAGNLRDLFVLLTTRGTKQVVHLHGGALRTLVEGLWWPLRVLNRLAFRGVKTAVVLGPSLRGSFHGLIPAERITCVSNFAESDVFLSDAEITAKHRVGGLRILFLGNLIASKGYGELSEAVAILRAEGADVELWLAGAFETSADGRRFRARYRGVAGVTHVGLATGNARTDLLRHAQVLCLPTRYPFEGQPLAILEAYASGCYVVTTLHAGIPDVFTPGANGASLSASSTPELVRALRQVGAIDPADRAAVGLRNARLARSLYTEERFLGQMNRVLGSS